VLQRADTDHSEVRKKNYDEIPMTYMRMMRRVVEKFRGYSMDIPAPVARTACSISLECMC